MRLFGHIKFYDHRMGMGYIQGSDNKQYPFYVEQIHESEKKHTKCGTVIRFQPKQDQATEIRLVKAA